MDEQEEQAAHPGQTELTKQPEQMERVQQNQVEKQQPRCSYSRTNADSSRVGMSSSIAIAIAASTSTSTSNSMRLGPSSSSSPCPSSRSRSAAGSRGSRWQQHCPLRAPPTAARMRSVDWMGN